MSLDKKLDLEMEKFINELNKEIITDRHREIFNRAYSGKNLTPRTRPGLNISNLPVYHFDGKEFKLGKIENDVNEKMERQAFEDFVSSQRLMANLNSNWLQLENINIPGRMQIDSYPTMINDYDLHAWNYDIPKREFMPIFNKSNNPERKILDRSDILRIIDKFDKSNILEFKK